jgi:hypothetical protein
LQSHDEVCYRCAEGFGLTCMVPGAFELATFVEQPAQVAVGSRMGRLFSHDGLEECYGLVNLPRHQVRDAETKTDRCEIDRRTGIVALRRSREDGFQHGDGLERTMCLQQHTGHIDLRRMKIGPQVHCGAKLFQRLMAAPLAGVVPDAG